MIIDGYKLQYPGMWIFTPSSSYSIGVRGQVLSVAREEARRKMSQDAGLKKYINAVDEDEFWRYEMDLADKDELELKRWRREHPSKCAGVRL